MSLLVILWLCAAALVAGALMSIVVIGVMRLVRRVRLGQAVRVRARMLALVSTQEEARSELTHLVAAAARHDTLAGIVLQVSLIVRGRLRDAFVARLAAAGAVEALSARLRYGRTMSRVRAAEALAAFGDHGAAAALRQGWSDCSPRVRYAALYAAAEIGAGPTLEAALTMALAAKGRKRFAACGLLRRLALVSPEETADWLERIALDAKLVRALIEGLTSAAPNPRIGGVLKSAARHGDPDVRASAIAALAVHGAASAHDTIAEALADPSWPVRVRAAAAAGKLRIADASGALNRLKEHDPNWWVRHRAGEALAHIDAPSLAVRFA